MWYKERQSISTHGVMCAGVLVDRLMRFVNESAIPQLEEATQVSPVWDGLPAAYPPMHRTWPLQSASI